jgi:hypothetical protein
LPRVDLLSKLIGEKLSVYSLWNKTLPEVPFTGAYSGRNLREGDGYDEKLSAGRM